MEHRERELVSMGTGIALAVLAGLVVWLRTESAGWAVVVALIVGTSVWLWFRQVP
jgi:hypothetical protein